jgi:hypothetical protein
MAKQKKERQETSRKAIRNWQAKEQDERANDSGKYVQ